MIRTPENDKMIRTPGELRDGATSSSRPRQTREGDEDATKQ